MVVVAVAAVVVVVVVVVEEARQAWFDQVQMTKQEHCDAVVVAVVNEDMVVAAVDDVVASAWAYVLRPVAHQGNFQVGYWHLTCPDVVVVAAVTYDNPSFGLTQHY